MGWVARVRKFSGACGSSISGTVPGTSLTRRSARAGSRRSFETSQHGGRDRRTAAQRGANDMVQPDVDTWAVEVAASEIALPQPVPLVPPFVVTDDVRRARTLRLKSRYLDLRRVDERNVDSVTAWCSPSGISLTRRLPRNQDAECSSGAPRGRAGLLFVPSRLHRGNLYALPRSPPLYKQILVGRWSTATSTRRSAARRGPRADPPEHTHDRYRDDSITEPEVFVSSRVS